MSFPILPARLVELKDAPVLMVRSGASSCTQANDAVRTSVETPLPAPVRVWFDQDRVPVRVSRCQVVWREALKVLNRNSPVCAPFALLPMNAGPPVIALNACPLAPINVLFN